MGTPYRKLSEDFIVPPFSVFDTKTELWQSRKRQLRAIIGSSSETREGTLYDSMAMRMPDIYSRTKKDRENKGLEFDTYILQLPVEKLNQQKAKDAYSGVSSFDPVLAEVLIHWFTPFKGARIFDCFAGGITKGVVANLCGHQFIGLEIRKDQVETNRRKIKDLGMSAEYVHTDARRVSEVLGVATQDMLLTCPPYYNLEVYSNLPEDASNQPTYESYLCILRDSFRESLKSLKKNRFCVVIISDVRDELGAYRNLPGDVIDIFRNEGCFLWNEFILLNNDASAKLRARRYMNTRKAVRMHQKVLVFYNGNPRNIAKTFPKISNQ